MTKVNSFIANSDFLSLAQKSNLEFTAIFPQETFSGPQQIYYRSLYFNLPAINGALDEILMSYNGSNYMLGPSIWTGVANPAGLGVVVDRSAPDILRVTLRIVVYDVSSYSMPTQTLKIHVSSFLPPNVF